MRYGVMLMLTAGLLGLGACAGTPSEPVASSLNLPQPPESTIPAVASVGPTSGNISTVGSLSRFTPAMFPSTPDRHTRRANQQAIEALQAAPITPGDPVTPVVR